MNDLWFLIRHHPLIGAACAIQLGFGYAVEIVSPRLALRMAERELRRINPRLLALKPRKQHRR